MDHDNNLDDNNLEIDNDLEQAILESLKLYDETKDLEEMLVKSQSQYINNEDLYEKTIQESINDFERKLKLQEDRLIREEQDREFENLQKILETPSNINISEIKQDITNIKEINKLEEDIPVNLDKRQLREARLKYFQNK